jgi:double zinc ribbon protein
MGSTCPPHWTFAARAAYFGDRMCAFCQHRNPAGAKFCNDCAAPLHLKPCKQCDAVNDQAATNCYKCGAACPVSLSTPEATPVVPAADSTPVATTANVAVVTTVTQPPFTASALGASWRLLSPGQLLVAAIATILIVGAYVAFRTNVATHDAMGVASQPIAAHENNATTATPAVPGAVESKPVEPERTAALPAPTPAIHAEAPKRASVRERRVPIPTTKGASAHQRPVPVPDTKRASARQPPVHERRAPVGEARPVAHGLASARVRARVAQMSKALRADRWQVMRVSLARCGGDLIARIVCDQRVRRHFCDGHWGEAPACASGLAVAIEHGQ